MIRLIKNQVINMHSLLIKRTGGSSGIRDDGLLTSALNSPFQTFDGEDLYDTIHEKAAKLCYFLVKNHPFTDGNKRIGVLSMLVFLEINGIKLTFTNADLVRIGFGLADGSVNEEDLLLWIVNNSR